MIIELLECSLKYPKIKTFENNPLYSMYDGRVMQGLVNDQALLWSVMGLPIEEYSKFDFACSVHKCWGI